MTYYAFKAVHEELQKEGVELEDLKLKTGETEHVSERGFRDFLARMVNIPWDDTKITELERGTLNDMLMYLSVPMETEAEPVVQSSGLGVGDIIAQNQQA